MTMRSRSASCRSSAPTARVTPARSRIGGPVFRLALAGLLGIAVPFLVSCGSSGGSLIPPGNAGPLQSDFEVIAQAAENGDGSCTATEAAVLKTERDFSALPSSVDAGLRNRLREGISKLRSDALALCQQPPAQSTATGTTKTTTSTTSTSATPPTPTSTTPSTTTGTSSPSGPTGGATTPGPSGGAAAPPAGSEPVGGTGASESGAGGGSGGSSGAGAGAGGQEVGK
jgi:hypothetical protein